MITNLRNWRWKRPAESSNPEPVAPPSVAAGTLPPESQLKQWQKLAFAPDERTISGLSGEHRSKRRGPSPEFADYKPYSPGDDFRRIDWNTYARLDQLTIRESETTTERDIYLFVDLSPSMNWSSDPGTLPTKLDHAARIAAMLGYIGIWHFDRCAIHGFGGGQMQFGPVQGRSNALRLFAFCHSLQAGTSSNDDVDAIVRTIRARKRPGRLVLLSDFLWASPALLRAVLREAAGRRWHSTVVMIEDPAEREPERLFAESANLDLVDLESNASMYVGSDTHSLAAYTRARSAWIGDLRSQCDVPGITWVQSVSTDTDHSLLIAELIDRQVLQR